MTFRTALFVTAFLFTGTSSSNASAQLSTLPYVRRLGAAERTSTELLGAVSTARALRDGRVLVNDIIGRRLLLFDSTLASFTIVADTTSATGNAYGSRVGGLIAYRGDTSVFVDPTSLSMLVIDAKGTIARTMSIPRPSDAYALIGGSNGNAGFDAQGRLVYRALPHIRSSVEGERPHQEAQRSSTHMEAPEFADTQAVIRIELATRRVDTVGFLNVPRPKMNAVRESSGRMRVSPVINPLLATDDWAILADGSIALVRVADYHVDWVRPDGARESSAKLPFQWRHLTDSDKVAYIDSVKTALATLRAAAIARMASGGPASAIAIGEATGGAQVARGGALPLGASNQPHARDEVGGPTTMSMMPFTMIAPYALPDYAPPFMPGAARADEEGYLWIRTTNEMDGGSIYDVVDRAGSLVDRVVVPPGRVIAGFGPANAVFMGVRSGTGVRLERARRVPTTP